MESMEIPVYLGYTDSEPIAVIDADALYLPGVGDTIAIAPSNARYKIVRCEFFTNESPNQVAVYTHYVSGMCYVVEESQTNG